jgi:hypothetical protein
MANYKQHLSGGIILGTVCMLLAIFSLSFTIVNGFTVFVLVTLGSLLPDIDCDTSKPVQLLFEILGILIPIIILKKYFSNEVNVENIIFLLVTGYIFVRFGASVFFKKLTVHRGIIHSIPAAVIAGGTVFFLFYNSTFYCRFVYTLSCAGGFLLHLIMDEIWSVDLANVRIKNSFGTALSLKSDSRGTTLIAYLVIILMATYTWLNVPIPENFAEKQDTQSIVLLNPEKGNMSWADEVLAGLNSNWSTLCKKFS